ALLRPAGIPLIINDRLDVALAVQADGVHLGQQDMDIADARLLAGPAMIIGISVESLADAVRAEHQGADYLGISPVFATPTKTDTAAPLGLEGVARIRRAVALPLVGIGGIKADNAAAVIAAGADGVAVVSAIVAADCPRTAAAELKGRIAQAREGRMI
ncbi:MAG: thiamine phosphate synthase, partial [Desulfoprunum sp.]|uniref:thiamine phosphate synthase n=1 Tax=Desulfoprunum sp. TaxID=2020866 RepID=UPI003C73C8F4